MTDSAIDVGCFLAGAADEVVMVVTGSRFVACGRSSRLDAADQAFFREDREGIIDRLPRD